MDTFADENGLPQVPGPLIRARVGTRVTATVRNTLADSLWLTGLQNHVSDALDAGFSDQSHFTRVFRQTFGETPARYSRSMRGR